MSMQELCAEGAPILHQSLKGERDCRHCVWCSVDPALAERMMWTETGQCRPITFWSGPVS